MQKIILIIICVLTLSGCSVLKKSSGKAVRERYVSDAELLGITLKNNVSGRNFYISKALITVETASLSTRLIASIKHRTPDSLLVIIRSAIGTEIARMLMTNDTIMINDRLNKELLTGKPGIRTLKYGISPDILFVVLGDIILNPVDRNQKTACMNGYAIVLSEVNGKMINYKIDCKRQKVSTAKIEENIFTERMDLLFGKIKNYDGLIIPETIEFSEPDSEINVRIEIVKVESEWNGTIDFTPARSYKRMIIR